MTTIFQRSTQRLAILLALAAFVRIGFAAQSPTSAAKPSDRIQSYPVDLSAFVSKTWDKIQPGSSWSAVPHGQYTSDGLSFQLAGARVKVTVENESGPHFFGEHKTDARGETVVLYPADGFSRLGFQVSAEGRMTQLGWAEIADSPKELEFKLERGATIGGIVQDETGQPIAGVKVQINGVRRDEVGQFVSLELDTTQTDRSGKWSSGSVPKNAGTLSFTLTHPEFMTAEYDQATESSAAGKVVKMADLQSSKAIMRMQSGLRVDGTATDETGQALAGAEVSLAAGPKSENRRLAKTDNKGYFKFVVMEPSESYVVVQARAFTPEYQVVQVERGLKPLQFKLGRGKTLKGRVVDSDGRPVEGATVSLQSWNDLQVLNWSAKTDKEGRFSWDGAPDGILNLSVSKSGFVPASAQARTVEEAKLTMDKKTLLISGQVIDAETKEPIKKFKIVYGWVWNDEGEQVRWEFREERNGSDGSYSFDAPIYLSPTLGNSAKLMVRADGYLAATSPTFPRTGWHQYDFELKRGKAYSGIIKSPSGKPVFEADVALLGAGYLNLQKHALGTYDRRGVFMDKTDNEGHFTLPAALPSPTILAVHELGYAEFPAARLATNSEVILQAWGSIEGVMRNGSQPAPNELIMVAPAHTGQGSINYDFETYKTTTDDQGRFQFEAVPPGERQLVRLIPMTVSGGSTFWEWSQQQQRITVKSGEVTEVAYGGVGRPVVAKLVLSDPNRKVDWNVGHYTFNTQYPQPPRALKTLEEAREWNGSPEMKEARKKYRSYGFRIADDGALRIENVLPGTYQLQIILAEPGEDRSRTGSTTGTLTREVVVPEAAGGVSDEPVDLGTLTIEVRKN